MSKQNYGTNKFVQLKIVKKQYEDVKIILLFQLQDLIIFKKDTLVLFAIDPVWILYMFKYEVKLFKTFINFLNTPKIGVKYL